jgi:hypothetical protein
MINSKVKWKVCVCVCVCVIVISHHLYCFPLKDKNVKIRRVLFLIQSEVDSSLSTHILQNHSQQFLSLSLVLVFVYYKYTDTVDRANQ